MLIALTLLGACGSDVPPRTVTEFEENPMLLEAAVVRCNQNRSESRYDAECVNAREAVKRVEAREAAARREELERQSEAKRRALRRAQAAAAEARRRAEAAQRQQSEAEYLAQFGDMPPVDDGLDGSSPAAGNVPIAVIPDAADVDDGAGYESETLPAADGGNAPAMRVEPDNEPIDD